MTKYICVLLYVLAVSHCQTFKKVMIPDSNAVCLDGSPGAYYLADAGTNPRKFMIYFEGGGWCGAQDLPTTLESCYQRRALILEARVNILQVLLLVKEYFQIT